MIDFPHATDNIRVTVFDAEDAPTAAAAQTTVPKREYSTHNTTRDAYHKQVVSALNGANPDLTVDALALGDATTATTNLAESAAVGNEVFRTNVVSTSTNGQTFVASAFIDSTESVGQELNEAALVSERAAGDIPINRFLISDPGGILSPKGANETITIDIRITQKDA
jgi:hypothetical protein